MVNGRRESDSVIARPGVIEYTGIELVTRDAWTSQEGETSFAPTSTPHALGGNLFSDVPGLHQRQLEWSRSSPPQ